MARFTQKTNLRSSLENRRDVTVNKAGGVAYVQSPKTEMFLRCATLLPGEDKFYASGSETMDELRRAVERVMQEDPEFVLKLAAYLRSELYMRHAPLALVAEYARVASLARAEAKFDSGSIEIDTVAKLDAIKNPSKYVDTVIQRADEIPNLVALCMSMNKDEHIWAGKLPMMIKRGIATSFNKFDEYQFGKYGRQTGVNVTMRDALFMVHPKASTGEQQAIFNKIAGKTLEPPLTWEEQIMQKGSNAEAWENIIPRMGHMALLRNLRNFVKAGVSSNVLDGVAKRISDPNEIARGKQFPFRYYAAYRALAYDDLHGNEMFTKAKLHNALRTAIEMSAANVPRIPGRSVIFVDVSGSMTDKPISKYSTLTPKDIAVLYGAILNNITENAVMGAFATEFALVRAPGKDIFGTREAIDKIHVGGSTNAWKAFEWLRDEKVQADRVFLFSDMQHWNDQYVDLLFHYGRSQHTVPDSFVHWTRETSPNAMLYSIDLTGYGTSSLPDKYPNVVTIAGWSEKIFKFAACVEQKEDMISAINAVTV